jgi:Putative adhesin
MRFSHVTAALAFAGLVLQLAAAQREGSFDRTLTVSGAVDLNVETASGRIAVRSGDTSSVHIHGIIRAHEDFFRGDEGRIHEIETNPPISQTGNSIRISMPEDDWLRRRLAIEYELVVPQQTRLRAHTGSGSENVEGIHGPVELETGSGSVTVARVDDEVRVRTGSGRIEIDSVKGRVDAHTGSGSIEGSAIRGPISAHTGSGSMRLEQTAAGPLEAQTGSGGVNVRLPSDAAFDLYAHTGSGQVYVDHPITVHGNLGGHEIQGKVKGGGALVDVRTGSGSVRIE